MKSLLILSGALFLSLSASVQAQTSDVLTYEGVVGDVDKDHRGPQLSVRPIVGTDVVQLVADAAVPNKNFVKYPIRFDFFVNRKLYSSQMKSVELPGAIGVEIPKTFAPLPFNYSVVATLIHPNKTYTTMITGAVFASSLTGTLDCTLTVGDDEFVANGVTASQITTSTFSLAFTAKDETQENEASLSTTVNVSGTNASASLSITTNGETTTTATTGTIALTDNKLSEIELTSSDDATTLSCS